jgi:hypothetical protein
VTSIPDEDRPPVGESQKKRASCDRLPREAAGADGMDPEMDRAEKHFIHGLRVRGEASERSDSGLSPDATHEIIEGDGEEQPTIRRRRFFLG